jgi:two-component system CheB/CheR fusion protein
VPEDFAPDSNEPRSADTLPTHVVGIGASAGGLKALERFFGCLGDTTGMAFVVIQHLSPDFTSMMPQILSRVTRMPIRSVDGPEDVERDTVYLLLPGREMIISNNRLLTTERPAGLNLPVDIFLHSLAEDKGPGAIGIVLSGTGSDGAAGIVDIHREGGLTMAQTLRSAEFDGMPKSAVVTGSVDMVLDPEHMPAALTGHAKRLKLRMGSDETVEVQPTLFDNIFSLLQARFNVNFAHYKPNTIIRRTERRMALRQTDTLAEYAKLLAMDSDELDALYHDLLIGVTRFFRDPDTWHFLGEEVIPKILKSAGREVRIWTGGCATGEEAYTLAILLHEAIRDLPSPPDVKIFATDVHQHSLDIASAGVYPRKTLEGLSERRIQQSFIQQADDYVIAPHLRRMVVFARQDVTVDPPFTKLDLVVCRNLLIYLTLDAQRKTLSLFHFALKRNGFLLLGSSEGLAELADEFDVIDARRNIYRKSSDRRLVGRFRMPSMLPGLHEHRELPSTATTTSTPSATAATASSRFLRGRPPNLLRAYDALMDAYVPPGLLIATSGELAHSFGNANRYLRRPSGAMTLYASELVLPELRLPLISALARVQKSEDIVRYAGIRVEIPGEGFRQVRLVVRPLPEIRSAEYLLVSFEEGEYQETIDLTPEEDGGAEIITSGTLQEELQYTREQLQATVEELETSNEELQATNEELIASNEELQSTNEELHSVNEELSTLNQDHENKITELQLVTEETDNLLRSIDIATVFVDQNMRIRKFTPNAARQFGLLKHDVNRTITHFRSLLGDANVLADLARVNAGGERVEREIRDTAGHYYLMRILPYERVDGANDGSVISFIDVERIKQGSLRLSRVFAELQVITHLIANDLAGLLERASGDLEAASDALGAGTVEAAVDALARARGATEQVSGVIGELRGLPRVEKDGSALVAVALEDVVRDLATTLDGRLREASAQLHVDSGLPIVIGDAEQLALAFYHLLDNALSYASGEPLSITIGASEQGGQVTVEIEDNAAGVDMHRRTQVFDLFFRGKLPPEGELTSGVGVGLALVRRIVERHGGEVWLESEPAVFTRVKFTLRSAVAADGG